MTSLALDAEKPPRRVDGVAAADLRLSLALALAAFAVAWLLSAARVGHGAPDFYVFWAAARHWQAPYDPAVVARLQAAIHLGGIWPFAYPPSFLLFVQPFARLPLTLAYPAWTAVSAALFVFAGSRLVRPRWAGALLMLCPPVFMAGELGQTTLLVGAAMIGGWGLAERRPALAGLLFAAAICIKPQAMLAAPIVLFGRWRVLGWMIGGALAIVAASVAFGVGPWLAWPGALAAFARIAPAADRVNPSALFDNPVWTLAVAAFGLVFAARNRNLLGMVGGALCLTPYAHDYDLAPLAPLALAWLTRPRAEGWGLAAAGGGLVAGVLASPLAVIAWLAAITVLRSPLAPRALQPRTALEGAA